MGIYDYQVQVRQGIVESRFGYPLPFLSDRERLDLDAVVATGWLRGQPMSLSRYLNSLGKGSFQVTPIEGCPHDTAHRVHVLRVTRP